MPPLWFTWHNSPRGSRTAVAAARDPRGAVFAPNGVAVLGRGAALASCLQWGAGLAPPYCATGA